MAVVIFVMAATFLIMFQAEEGAGEGETRGDPDVNFDITDSFDTSHSYKKGNTASVFYGDTLYVIPEVDDPDGDEIVDMEWTFETSDGSGPVHKVDDQVVAFTVGEDVLYSEEDGGDPVMPAYNSDPVDYDVTLQAWDDHGDSGTYTLYVTVYPLAQHTYTREVPVGNSTSNVSVSIVFRGLPNWAAENPEEISEEKPVYCYITATTSPDPNIDQRGGIGGTYDIHTVGCVMQDTSVQGVILAEITLPFALSEIDEYGSPDLLMNDLAVEYYSNVEKRFFPVPDCEYNVDQDIGAVKCETDHLSIYKLVIDSVYNAANDHYYYILPDLSVDRIEFSRVPVLNGQSIQIRATIENHGILHARNVDLKIYQNGDLIADKRLEIVRGAGGEVLVNVTYMPVMNNPENQWENHYIKVSVNKQRAINEGPSNYGNNENQELIQIVTAVNDPPSMSLLGPANDTEVKGVVSISGSSVDESFEDQIGRVWMPFGNNDFMIGIEKVGNPPPSVMALDYTVLDENGTEIPGMHGLTGNIYGLNFDDETTMISFQDNDRDGRVSAGDVYLIKNVLNGGKVSEGFKFWMNASSIKYLEISLDNTNWTMISAQINYDTGNWTYNWFSTTVPNGTVELWFRASDGMDHSNIVNLTLNVQNPVPNIKPVVTITEPAEGSKVSGKIQIKGNATDKDGEVQKVEISINDAEWIAVTGITSWNFEWDSSVVENGAYTIRVRAFDGEDYSETVTITITVDNEEKDENGGGFLAGFELMIVILAFGVMCISKLASGKK